MDDISKTTGYISYKIRNSLPNEALKRKMKAKKLTHNKHIKIAVLQCTQEDILA